MPTLRSGLIIAGAYADKVRRVMFAQLKGEMREGRIKGGDIAYGVAHLNKVIYRILVDELKIDKGDVIRITINYDVNEGKIRWDWNSLKLEVFRREPQDKVDEAVASIVKEAEKVAESVVNYSISKVGETEDGDQIYALELGGKVVGVFEVVPVDADFAYIKKGAVIEPTPAIIEKIRISLEGRGIDEVLREHVDELNRNAKYVETKEAEEIMNYILERVKEGKR